MNTAGRNAIVSSWKNPYVTDGLVAMWDGVWNAGGGIHDPNATTWKNIIGNNHNFIIDNATWDEKSLNVYGGSLGAHLDSSDFLTQNESVTVEYVIGIGENRSSQFRRIHFINLGPTIFNIPYYLNQRALMWNENESVQSYGWMFKSHGVIPSSKRNAPPPGNYQFSCIYQINNKVSVVPRCVYQNGIFLRDRFSTDGSAGEAGNIGSTSDLQQIQFWLYSVRSYSKELTSEEIAANYIVDKKRFKI